jgi:hypothetical protein
LTQAIEDAVDESGRVRRAVAPRQLDGLIEGDVRRCFAGVQQFVGAQPQDVAIDGGHTRQPPVLGCLAQPAIDVGLVRQDAVIQAETERHQRFIAEPITDEVFQGGAVDALVEIALKEQLQGHFTGTRASGHGLLWYTPFHVRVANAAATANAD